MGDPNIAWVATVYADWTILQLESGDCFGFNRQTGKCHKIPDPECPFVVFVPAEIVIPDKEGGHGGG